MGQTIAERLQLDHPVGISDVLTTPYQLVALSDSLHLYLKAEDALSDAMMLNGEPTSPNLWSEVQWNQIVMASGHLQQAHALVAELVRESR